MDRTTLALLATLLLCSAFSSAHHDEDVHSALEQYRQLQEWEFATTPIPIPKEGLRFALDTATWTLESGRIHLMRPLEDSGVTGFVFRGEGRFEMEVPDPVELVRLRRIAERPEIERLELPFDRLVLRTSNALVTELFPNPPPAAYSSNSTAKQRHDTWLEKEMVDVDARIIAALRNPADEYIRVDMKTDEWNWLTYDYDASRAEEVHLIRLQVSYPEIWVSLDRAEERLPSGRPSAIEPKHFVLEHINVKADLTDEKSAGPVGRSRTHLIDAEFEVKTRLRVQTGGASAVSLTLHPMAEVESVTDEDGEELTFFRDHIGGRALSLDSDIYDDLLVVVLDEPVIEDEIIDLTFTYELEIVNYVAGNVWHPAPVRDVLEPYTARLEIVSQKGNRVQAMGDLLEIKDGEDDRTTIWSIDRPTYMVSFATTRGFEEEFKSSSEGVPDIVTIGPMFGFAGGSIVRSINEDVANAIQYFQDLFGIDLPFERVFVTGIVATHGQSFDGFLHLPEETFNEERGGASELFRAHEVAHQWWGHLLRRRSYRDQWLAEAFAEYSAMMFVETKVKDGEKLLTDILRAYHDVVNGSIQSVFSRFSRQQYMQRNSKERNRLGPIDVGIRAGTRKTPGGYFIQTYFKGALVLHMMRVLLRYQSGSDDLFFTILRDFLKTRQGKLASTEDFRAIVEKHASGDWSGFFDQWIYGAEIPTLRWSYEASRKPDQEGNYSLSVRVRREDEGRDFIPPIPIRVELKGRESQDLLLSVINEEDVFRRLFPAPIEDVELNPDRTFLVHAKKE